MEPMDTKNRQFDIREGRRNYALSVRLTKKEHIYIEKLAKKSGVTKSAIVMEYFNAYKKHLKETEK